MNIEMYVNEGFSMAKEEDSKRHPANKMEQRKKLCCNQLWQAG